MASPLMRRLAALGLLGGAVLLAGTTVASALRSYMDGQREIEEKRAQLDGLRELAAGRAAFERLVAKKDGPSPVLAADADAAAVLQAAVTKAAENGQVIVDGVEALPPEPVTRSAQVHLRGTQAGLYSFLKALEQGTPYLLTPRLDVTTFRPADPEHDRPLVVSADLRVAILVAPAVEARRPRAPAAP